MTQNASSAVVGENKCYAKAGLTAGTTTTITTTTTVPYTINGAWQTSKTAITNGATPTVDANSGLAFKPLTPDTACIFAFFLDASGNVSVAQGPIVKNSDLTNGLQGADFPNIKDDRTLFGYLLARAGTTLVGTWTFGSNNLSGVTGMTYTFRDAATPPSSPVYS